MASGQTQVTGELLSAALDDELQEMERHQVADALRSPQAQAELGALAALKQRLRSAHPEQPLPASLLARLETDLNAVDFGRRPTRPVPSWWRRPQRWLLPAAAFSVLVAFGLAWGGKPRPSASSAVASRTWALSAQTLAASHRYWEGRFPNQPAEPEPAELVAQRLSGQVGFPVAVPDLQRLQARLRGCTACSSVAPGRQTAVFVLTGPNARAMSLFEIYAQPCDVRVDGFTPTRQPGVAVAESDGVSLAMWRHEQQFAWLASSELTTGELARLVPGAVRGAAAPRPVRLAALR